MSTKIIRCPVGRELQWLLKGQTAPFGNLFYSLNTCGDSGAANSETLILQAFAGLLDKNGDVFLSKLKSKTEVLCRN